MPQTTRRLALIVTAALLAASSPALAGTEQRPQTPASRADAGGSTGSVTVGFTVRPVIVVVVDDAGSPAQLWTNIPGSPTADELDAVQARLDSPRGTPVSIGQALRAQLPAILAGAGWGHQGLVWQRS